jgi:hypothetical protein
VGKVAEAAVAIANVHLKLSLSKSNKVRNRDRHKNKVSNSSPNKSNSKLVEETPEAGVVVVVITVEIKGIPQSLRTLSANQRGHHE